MVLDIEYELAILHDDIAQLDFRLTKLEGTGAQIADLLKEFHEQNKFIVIELMKSHTLLYSADNKTPSRRLKELEDSFQNFLTFYHEQGMRKHAPKAQKPSNEIKGVEL